MKDSQRSFTRASCGSKYIKADNERFSTMSDVDGVSG